MKIMLDANIIVSAILFPKSSITKALKHMIANEKLFLSKYTLDEIREVFERKFLHRLDDMKNFTQNLLQD
jgi:predicted nucleic acid-binding protein